MSHSDPQVPPQPGNGSLHRAQGCGWVLGGPSTEGWSWDGAGMELGHAAGDAPWSLPQHLCQHDDDDNSLQGQGGLTRMC